MAHVDINIIRDKYLKMLEETDRYSEEERCEIERDFSTQATELIFASLILEGRL